MRNIPHHYSSEDQSEEEDEVQFQSLPKAKTINTSKSADIFKSKFSAPEPQEDQEYELKPKLVSAPPPASSKAVMPNHSAVSQASKRPLTAAYTFKLKTPSQRKKKNDPVSLFQQTSSVWKKDKFLTSRADIKEGRKLGLEKRNKEVNKLI